LVEAILKNIQNKRGYDMIREKSPKLEEIETADGNDILSLKTTDELIPRLSTLLQKGCFVKVRTGCSLSDLLCDQFGISPDYIKNDIKVIFLDYSPVDDLDTAVIKDGAILALSAAMPGLVGAAMRRDGLSWMRSSITYHEQESKHEKQEGVLHVKLFNQVMADLGESFLRRGVYVKSVFLADFLGRFAGDFWQGVGEIARDREILTKSSLLDYLMADEKWVKFSIR
jgi:hypothetical protein